MLLAPRYGKASSADVVAALLSTLGVPGQTDRIGLGLDRSIRRICLLLIDGLGARLLAANPEAAPFLHSRLVGTALSSTPILTAGFPSTTATSLSSLGTGVPPGEHGVVGYLLAVPGQDRLMNPLAWRLHGPGPHVDLFKEVVPEEFQPRQTLFETAAADGVTVVSLGPAPLERSGLTRASLRGGTFRATVSLGDLAASAATALCEGERALVYAYHGELDYTGHVRGPRSDAWRLELSHVDRLAQAIARRLPADGALVVTADHGMVQVDDMIDIDGEPELTEGVRLLGGEPRARHIYTDPGATDRVRGTWQQRLGEDYEVLDRTDAIERGWFGPVIAPGVLPRIGDLLAVARSSGALIRRSIEPRQSSMLGHHGSLTPEEVEVPLLTFSYRS